MSNVAQTKNLKLFSTGYNTHNKEARPQQYSLYLYVQVHRELDAKVICVCEHLFHHPTPLLSDLSNDIVSIFPHHLSRNSGIIRATIHPYIHLPIHTPYTHTHTHTNIQYTGD